MEKKHPLKSIWTAQQTKRTPKPTVNKIQILKALIRQSSFLFFIKITALWGKKGSRRSPLSFPRGSLLKIVLRELWKGMDLPVLPVPWAYTSGRWKLLYHWGEGNNLSTSLTLSKCSIVKMNFPSASQWVKQWLQWMYLTSWRCCPPSLPTSVFLFWPPLFAQQNFVWSVFSLPHCMTNPHGQKTVL